MSIVTDWSQYPSFKASEFVCRCGCGSIGVSEKFMDMLQQARTMAGVPFAITSGCRCERHNNANSISVASDHLVGDFSICCGVDIRCVDPTIRHRMLKTFYEVGFSRIGIRQSFIHVGIGRSLGGRNDDDVVWLY